MEEVLLISGLSTSPLSPLCIQSASMWEFLLPWCQIMAQTLSPTNSKLFCLITSSHMDDTFHQTIQLMMTRGCAYKNLRSILNSVMQPARLMFCTLASFCLHHNTTPVANGAVPNSFVFQHVMQTHLSAQCTERAQPHAPEPIFM